MPLDDLRATLVGSRQDHRTLAERAFATLHDAIITGVLKPDERLPIEGLAEVLHVSPMPVREALRRLESVGLVEKPPHRSGRVAELSIADLTEVYEARMALEPLAIRHAAERFTSEDRERAREALDRLTRADRAGEDPEVWQAHTDFHFALYEASRSRWLDRLIKPLWESTERYRLAVEPMRRSLEDRQAEHELMLGACVRHAPRVAERELRSHLERTANAIAEAMNSEPLYGAKSNARGGRPRAGRAA